MSARLQDILSGAALIAVALMFYSQTVEKFAGVVLARNPMTFPRFLLSLLVVGGAVLVLRGLWPRGRRVQAGSGEGAGPATDWRIILMMAALTGAYLVAFAPLGFIAATALFLPLSCLLLGYRNIAVIVLATLATCFIVWVVFAQVFSIRPPGPGFDDLLRLLRGGADG